MQRKNFFKILFLIKFALEKILYFYFIFSTYLCTRNYLFLDYTTFSDSIIAEVKGVVLWFVVKIVVKITRNMRRAME